MFTDHRPWLSHTFLHWNIYEGSSKNFNLFSKCSDLERNIPNSSPLLAFKQPPTLVQLVRRKLTADQPGASLTSVDPLLMWPLPALLPNVPMILISFLRCSRPSSILNGLARPLVRLHSYCTSFTL